MQIRRRFLIFWTKEVCSGQELSNFLRGKKLFVKNTTFKFCFYSIKKPSKRRSLETLLFESLLSIAWDQLIFRCKVSVRCWSSYFLFRSTIMTFYPPLLRPTWGITFIGGLCTGNLICCPINFFLDELRRLHRCQVWCPNQIRDDKARIFIWIRN